MPDLETREAAPDAGSKADNGGITTRFLRGGRGRPRQSPPVQPKQHRPQPPFELGRPYPTCAPELASSWLSTRANFVHVALASLFGQDSAPELYGISEEDSKTCRERLPALVDAYEHQHGQVRASYFARHAFAATALTENDEMEITWGTQESLREPDYVALLLRCQQLSYTGWHRLSANDRQHCQNLVFAVAVEAVRRMDRAAESEAPTNGRVAQSQDPATATGAEQADEQALERLSRELDNAEDFMLRSAGRRAQIRYVKGMLLGLVPTLILIGAVVLAMEVLGVPDNITSEVALVGVAGALGALVSVLLRMTVGRFSMNLPTLDSDMRATDLRLIGMLRPAVGAVCGLAAYAFVQAALVPVESKADGPEVFLYMAIGFLAGFSERFFQDMFARSGQGLLGAVGDAPTSGPAAGLSPPPGRSRA